VSEVDHGDTHEVAPVAPVAPAHVVRVRLGHGANCSSIGSVVDTLFATAAVGAAVFAAVVAALAKEPVRERRPVTPGADDPPAGPPPQGGPPP
jgi:hypothetical protein